MATSAANRQRQFAELCRDAELPIALCRFLLSPLSCLLSACRVPFPIPARSIRQRAIKYFCHIFSTLCIHLFALCPLRIHMQRTLHDGDLCRDLCEAPPRPKTDRQIEMQTERRIHRQMYSGCGQINGKLKMNSCDKWSVQNSDSIRESAVKFGKLKVFSRELKKIFKP